MDELGLPLTLIGQGAEARLWRMPREALSGFVLASEPAGSTVVLKERFKKTYRHPTLDATLTKRRTRAEARMMQRLAASEVRVPAVYWPTPAEAQRRGYSRKGEAKEAKRLPARVMAMEDVGTLSAKAFIRTQKGADETYSEAAFALCRKLGAAIATMHAQDVVHGDLTTSNAMLVESEAKEGEAGSGGGSELCPYEVVLIDFGLSAVTASVEDKAVDLYVLERAFLCTHENSEALVQTVLAAYESTAAEQAKAKKPTSKKARQEAPGTKDAVLSKLEQVRQRGRKKLAFG